MAAMVPVSDVRYMIFAHYCITTAILTIMLRSMFTLNFQFFKTLYSRRRYEFKKHATREIPLSIISILCVAILMCMDFFVVFYFTCHLQDLKENVSSGICHHFNEGELIPWLNQHDHVTWVITLMTIETLVFIAFISLRKPHDCFNRLSVHD